MAHETDRLNRALAERLNDPVFPERVCPVHGSEALLEDDDEGFWRCVEIVGPHEICWQKAVRGEVVQNYCGSLDKAVAALNELDLEWDRYLTYGGGRYVAVWPRSQSVLGGHKGTRVADSTPAALATALVQAALKVLEKEDPSCPN